MSEVISSVERSMSKRGTGLSRSVRQTSSDGSSCELRPTRVTPRTVSCPSA
jgi:hypothetical protein